jgi:hypothetical protein
MAPEETDRPDDALISPTIYISSILAKLRLYYRLLLVLMSVLLLGAIVLFALLTPSYTAVATIGPPTQSLDDLSSGNAGGLLGSLSGMTKRIGLAALASGGGADLFGEYQELLTSNRVAAMIANDPNVLRTLFYRKYDWQENRWKVRGPLQSVTNRLKRLLHYPIKNKPDRDDVAKFLNDNLIVDAPLTSNFATVSLAFKDPIAAQWLLNVVLRDADQLIRNDRKRDVLSRVRYLTAILPQISNADQKTSISAVLLQQEQSLMMIYSDERYGATIVDTPHADRRPTAPSPLQVFGGAVLLALFFWGVLVYSLSEDNRLLLFFSKRPNDVYRAEVP